MSASISRLMTVTASTKRAPALASGKRGTPAASLATVLCTPIDPVAGGKARDHLLRMGINTPIALFQTVTAGGQDIVAGDVLVVGSQEYEIRLVDAVAQASLEGTASSYLLLILEKVKP